MNNKKVCITIFLAAFICTKCVAQASQEVILTDEQREWYEYERYKRAYICSKMYLMFDQISYKAAEKRQYKKAFRKKSKNIHFNGRFNEIYRGWVEQIRLF